ncbi:MAG: hypothetical protein CMM56_10005 [Rhodospirillaceae bacterium]|nr:hypothetical protein [Rhodospirillaceae bacterium]|tara:strand:- start:89 stop:433 length:345 start_codon:yes stop_codon:yes gene_type:complete
MGYFHLKSKPIVVLTTCANTGEADEIAITLVEKKLAACVNRVDGLMSTYKWNSKIQQEHEILLIIKTTNKNFEELKKTIQDRTSYALPEIIALPIYKGSAKYIKWLYESLEDGY